MRGADATIRRALRITPEEVNEHLAAREERLLSEIAADMTDAVPCSEESFREEFARRYELDLDRDEDVRLIARVLGRILRYPDETHDAPFVVTFPNWPLIDRAEVHLKKDRPPS